MVQQLMGVYCAYYLILSVLTIGFSIKCVSMSYLELAITVDEKLVERDILASSTYIHCLETFS